MKKHNIIYVDDELSLLEVVKTFLEKRGKSLEVKTTSSAKEALTMIKKEPVDVIVSDYMMPEMDGLEFLAQLREEGNSTPFIIFTGKGTEEVAVEAFRLGADYYLQKRGDAKSQFRELINLIEKSLEKKSTEEMLKRERKAFHIIADAAVNATGIPDLCRRILAGLIENLGFDFGTIRLYDEKERCLNPTATIGLNEEEKKRIQPRFIDDPRYITTFVARTREPLFASDVLQEEILEIYNLRLEQYGIKKYISWPILDTKDNLLGTIQLCSRIPKEIPEDDRIFFVTIAGTFATVLERMQIEKALRESEKNYRTLVETLPYDLAVLIVQDGRIAFANTSAKEIFRVKTVDDLIGVDPTQFVADCEKKRLKKYMYARFSDEPPPNKYETSLRRSNGDEFPVEIFVNITTFHGQAAVQVVIYEISKWKQIEETLQEKQEQLQKQRDELESFASTVAHDLRGKLQVISLYNDLAKSEYSDKIKKQILEIAKFLADLLLLAMKGEILGELLPIDLNNLIEKISKKISSLDPDLKVEIKKLPIVAGDEIRLQQVFENLLINVVKHAEATKVEVFAEELEKEYKIVIRDNGKGMTKKKLEELQREFKTKKYTHLGLQIAKKIIKAYNGRITIESGKGKGSSFMIYLPK